MKSPLRSTHRIAVYGGVAWITLFAATLPALAANDEGLTIATKNACTACHSVDKKVVGPAFQAIAQKYKDDKDGQAKIEESIRKGSTGKWGPIPMPPNATVNDGDVKLLSAWILSR
jgi:cytochrome c